MLDREWVKSLVEAGRSILLGETPPSGQVDSTTLLQLAGARHPKTEAERLILIGLASDVSRKLAHLEDETNDPIRERTAAIIAYIRGHSALASLSRSEAARELGISESWIAHHLKAASGRSFTQHLETARFVHARRLLTQSELSIKAIALTVGYGDAGGFIRRFRCLFGRPPGLWRNSQRAGRNSQEETKE